MSRARLLVSYLLLLIFLCCCPTTFGQGVMLGSFNAGGPGYVFDWFPFTPTTTGILTSVTSQEVACANGFCYGGALYVICSVNGGTYNGCPAGSLLATSDAEGGYGQCNGSCPFLPVSFSFSGSNQIVLQAGQTYYVRPYICSFGANYCGGGEVLAGGLQTFTGIPVNQVSALPTSLNFQNQTVNVTSPGLGVVLTNNGESSIEILALPTFSGANPADFLIAEGTTCTPETTIPPQGSCLIVVTFTPSAAELESASLSILGGGNAQELVSLTGTGVPPLTAPQNPPSRPVVFVTGICEESDDWWALRSSVSADLNQNLPTLFPNEKNYDVHSGASVVFESNANAGDESIIPQTAIPVTARFFTVKFINPVGNDNDPSGAAQVSILNKANELSQIIHGVMNITKSTNVIMVAHSMGGVVARAYLENLGSTSPCYDVTIDSGNFVNGSPDYTHGCQPGDVAYSNNIAVLVTLDTPHGGSELAKIALTSPVDVLARILPCLGPPSTARTEMLPQSQLLSTLNYFASLAGLPSPIPTYVSVQSIESFLSDANPGWESNPLILDNPSFALSENDGAISSGSQSMNASLAPAAQSAVQFGDSTNSYTLATISGQPLCQLDGLTILHLIACLGQQQGTESLVYKEIEPFAKQTVAIAASVGSPIYGHDGNFSAIVTITNTGNTALDSVQLSMNQTTLGGVVESIPITIGGLEPGASATVTLIFPTTPALSVSASAPLKISGTYAAGSLSGNWSVTFRSVSLNNSVR